MSEPWATVVAHTNYVKGKITHQGSDYERIIQACIKLQCKPEIGRKIDRIFFKQAPWGSAEVEFCNSRMNCSPHNFTNSQLPISNIRKSENKYCILCVKSNH